MKSSEAMRKLIQWCIRNDSREVLWTWDRLMIMTRKEVDFRGGNNE